MMLRRWYKPSITLLQNFRSTFFCNPNPSLNQPPSLNPLLAMALRYVGSQQIIRNYDYFFLLSETRLIIYPPCQKGNQLNSNQEEGQLPHRIRVVIRDPHSKVGLINYSLKQIPIVIIHYEISMIILCVLC